MKRALLFLLLVAIGIGALYVAVLGDEDSRASSHTAPAVDPGRERQGPGVPLQGRGTGSATVAQFGVFGYTKWDRTELPDGSVRREELYALRAEESRPVGEGLQQLDRITVKVFDNGRHAATIAARQAFVTLARDANDQVSLREDKEIDLRDAVLTGEPGSRFEGVRLALGDCRVQVQDEQVRITTLPDQPVLLTMAGERSATLRGHGAVAVLPRGGDGALQDAKVDILRDPVLETQGVVVRAKGPLQYVERVAAGAAEIVLVDDVELDFEGADWELPGTRAQPARDGEVQRATVRGDKFVGSLQRDETLQPDGTLERGATWRKLELTGAPATVTGAGAKLSTPRLTALPGLFDEPWLLTAHGPSQVEHTEVRHGKQRTVVATTERRMRFVRIGEFAGAPLRSFGFPRWTLRPLDDTQVGICEGPVRFTGDARTIEAAEGARMHVDSSGGVSFVRGFGRVRVEQRAASPGERDLIATNDAGFLRTVTLAGEELRFASGNEGFHVVHGDATLRGHGTCDVTSVGTGTRVHVVSPEADLVAAMPSEGLELRSVRELRALSSNDEVRELEASGWPAEVTLLRSKHEETVKVTARAPRIVQIGPRSLRLLPVPPGAPSDAWRVLDKDRLPRVSRSARTDPQLPPEVVEVTGPEIDVHHAGGHAAAVHAVAEGPDRPRVYAVVPQAGHGEPTTIACDAERLRLWPFVLSPEARAFHAAGFGPFADAVFHATGQPWLIVDDVRDFQLDDERQGHVEGRAKRLLVSQGGRAALFVGDPDDMAPAVVRRRRGDRDVTMSGARVRVFDEAEARLDALGTFADRSVFLPPTMTLHEAGKTGLLSHMRATCRGNIEARSEAVFFHGPVIAQGLRADGSEDPDGVHLDARELHMARDVKTGDVLRVLAKDVVLDWTKLSAKATDLELDLVKKLCVVSDPRDAIVDLPNGWRYVAPRLEVNYETLAMRHSRARFMKRDEPLDGPR